MVLDCPDPRALASFYASLLGASASIGDREWCEVFIEEPRFKLAFQLAQPYHPPQWPNGVPQQLQLDLTVSDLEAASARAESLGAAVLTGKVEEEGGMFIVHADPAGHPFAYLRSGLTLPGEPLTSVRQARTVSSIDRSHCPLPFRCLARRAVTTSSTGF